MKFGQKLIHGYADLDAQRKQQEALRKLGFDDRNRRVVDALRQNGDVPSIIRDVRHIVQLASDDKLEAFKRAVDPLGFDFGRTSEDKLENGTTVWTVFFTAKHATDLGSITRYSQTMRSNAHAYGGIYMGWETEVTRLKGAV